MAPCGAPTVDSTTSTPGTTDTIDTCTANDT
jgi:hypothetical protein